MQMFSRRQTFAFRRMLLDWHYGGQPCDAARNGDLVGNIPRMNKDLRDTLSNMGIIGYHSAEVFHFFYGSKAEKVIE